MVFSTNKWGNQTYCEILIYSDIIELLAKKIVETKVLEQ